MDIDPTRLQRRTLAALRTGMLVVPGRLGLPRLPRYLARLLNRPDRDAWHRDQAGVALAGERAAEICRHAERLGVHQILMGSARGNSMTRMLEASVTHRVLEATPVPVEIVAGEGRCPSGSAGACRPARWGRLGGLTLLAMD